MTIKELKEILNRYSDDYTVTYRHNKYGCIDVDAVDYKEEILPSGQTFKYLILEADFMED